MLLDEPGPDQKGKTTKLNRCAVELLPGSSTDFDEFELCSRNHNFTKLRDIRERKILERGRDWSYDVLGASGRQDRAALVVGNRDRLPVRSRLSEEERRGE